MGINKKDQFAREDLELADFAKAIGHPARIAILKTLAERESCICGEIVEVLPLAQSTVSQHLKELKEAGLIRGTVEGVKSCYCINWETFDRFSAAFSHTFGTLKITQQNSKCC
jgi:ArsR family transcriptional regulator, arsenate/arsenite/antimonite-responsive transcriptional repressor